MTVTQKTRRDRQLRADGRERFIAAGRRHAIRLGEQRAFQGRMAAAPFGDLQTRAQFRIRLVYRMREQARQKTMDAIRTVLGDGLFTTWLQRDDAAYQRFAALAEQQQQQGAELELWRAKNDFTLQYLNLRVQNLSADQFKAGINTLRLQSESRVAAIIGTGGVQRGGKAVFDWLQSGAGPVPK